MARAGSGGRCCARGSRSSTAPSKRLMAGLGLHGAIRGKPNARSFRTRRRRARRIMSTGCSMRQPRTGSGSRTLPTSRSGRASSLSPSRSMPALGGSSVGGARTAHASLELGALEQALHQRRLFHRRGLVHCGPWRSFEPPAFATLTWVDYSTIAGCRSPPATSHRPRPRSATTPAERAGHRGSAQTKRPPAKPGPFTEFAGK